MDNISLVKIPQLGTNDDTATIGKWVVETGQNIKRGDIITEIETTKSCYEIISKHGGYIYILESEGNEIGIDQPIAFISKKTLSNEELDKIISVIKKEDTDVQEYPKMTEKARKLLEESDLNMEDLPKDKIITESDIKILIEAKKINNILDSFDKKKLIKRESNKLNKIAIYGAGYGGVVLYQTIMSMEDIVSEVVYFIDDDMNKRYKNLMLSSKGKMFTGIQIITLLDLKELIEERRITHLIPAIANRTFLYNFGELANIFKLDIFTAVHPKSTIGNTTIIGTGCHIKEGAIVGEYSNIGDFSIIDNNASISHHSNTGKACHIAPGAVLGSSVQIGDRSLVGTGAVVPTGIKIGKNVIIGAGAVVTEDIKNNDVVAGNPAKVIGKNKK